MRAYRDSRKHDPAFREQRNWANTRSKYGLNENEFNRLLESQQGRCALCPRELDTRRVAFIDHNHRNGIVRGLLCQLCNLSISRLEMDGWLGRSLQYLESPGTGFIEINHRGDRRPRKPNFRKSANHDS